MYERTFYCVKSALSVTLAFSQHVCIKALIVPVSLISPHVLYTSQMTAEQKHTHLGQHNTGTKRIVVTQFGVQWTAKWAWLKAQRTLKGNKGDEGRS